MLVSWWRMVATSASASTPSTSTIPSGSMFGTRGRYLRRRWNWRLSLRRLGWSFRVSCLGIYWLHYFISGFPILLQQFNDVLGFVPVLNRGTKCRAFLWGSPSQDLADFLRGSKFPVKYHPHDFRLTGFQGQRNKVGTFWIVVNEFRVWILRGIRFKEELHDRNVASLQSNVECGQTLRILFFWICTLE